MMTLNASLRCCVAALALILLLGLPVLWTPAVHAAEEAPAADSAPVDESPAPEEAASEDQSPAPDDSAATQESPAASERSEKPKKSKDKSEQPGLPSPTVVVSELVVRLAAPSPSDGPLQRRAMVIESDEQGPAADSRILLEVTIPGFNFAAEGTVYRLQGVAMASQNAVPRYQVVGLPVALSVASDDASDEIVAVPQGASHEEFSQRLAQRFLAPQAEDMGEPPPSSSPETPQYHSSRAAVLGGEDPVLVEYVGQLRVGKATLLFDGPGQVRATVQVLASDGRFALLSGVPRHLLPDTFDLQQTLQP